MKILIRELKKLCSIILTKIVDGGMREIDFGDISPYWTVSFNSAYLEPYGEEDLTHSYLSGDWKYFEELMEKREHEARETDLEKLGSILEAMSYVLTHKRKRIGGIKVSPFAILQLCKMLIKKVERFDISEIDVDTDEYWYVDPDDAYSNVAEQRIIKGSLKDEWNKLKEIFDDKRSVDFEDLRRLGRMIKVLRYCISKKNLVLDLMERTWGETEEDVFCMQFLEKALQKNPDDVEALVEQGFLYFDAFHEPEKAFDVLNRVLKIDPENLDAMFWLSEVLYHDLRKHKEAEEILEKALSIDPDHVCCNAFLARVLYQVGTDLSKPIEHLKKVVEMEPTWIGARIDLAYDLLEMKRIEEAEKMAIDTKKALEILKIPTPANRMEDFLEESISRRMKGAEERVEWVFESIEEARQRLWKKI